MPIYEYKCLDCGQEFEEIRSASSEEPVSCPNCKSENTQRLLSGFSSLTSGSDFSSSSCFPSTGSGFS